MISRLNYHFRNWAGNEQCFPEKYFQPESESDIVAVVKDAVVSGKKIRVVGAGHSWSAVACSDEYMINLDRCDKVISVDKEKKQIRVQAGIRLKQLNKGLEEHGLALINLGSISEQSIAGATATGTHGTGIRFQILPRLARNHFGSDLAMHGCIQPQGRFGTDVV
jgi:L-gulonolactone oxidase